MGVKDLWHILSPLCDRKPMFELQGKTIAIDLSCWVVDSQTVTDNSAQPKMYLRNLYFRTAFLLTQGISPVFVLEGKAPTVKHDTIKKRNDIRNGFRERKTLKKGGRSQFNRTLNECKEMLKLMGLACVQGHGEAEAMCAYLNEDGLVDGCISQDSDCFLYGAKVVYRNFCISAQGNRCGNGGAVDEYSMEKIERILNLGRNKMIALALLCGCDYSDGLNGVGKEAAMKLCKIVDDEHILERIQNWRTDNSLDQKEAELLYSNLCTSCGHNGKVQKHAKSGCVDCGTVVKCSDSFKEKRALILNEVALRKKALLVEDFPNQEVIEEFLVRKDQVPTKLDLQWKQPQISKFIDFVERHLSWEPHYAFEKIFPLATRWQLLHLPDIVGDRSLTLELFVPEAIKKIRNIRSVASYEIIWKSEHSVIEKLRDYLSSVNDDADNADVLSELTSIESQDAVSKCYPELVEVFENMRNTKAKKRTAKGKSRKNANDNTDDKENDKAKTRTRKNAKKAVEVKNNKKIDEFILANPPLSLEDSFEKMSITPKRCKQQNVEVGKLYQGLEQNTVQLKRGPQFDKVIQTEEVNRKLNNTIDRMFNELSPDDFISDNDENDLNMTEIIENICSRKTFQYNVTKHTLATTTESELNATNNEHDNTVAPSLNIGKGFTVAENTIKCDESIDEFENISESYVPLNQRILDRRQTKRCQTGSIENGRFTLGIDDLLNDTDFKSEESEI